MKKSKTKRESSRLIQKTNSGVSIKISVIVPVYNSERHLSQCLDSLVHQTLKDIEVIVLDRGSTDENLRISQEFARKDSRITILADYNREDFRGANGQYILCLYPGDFLNPIALERLYQKAVAVDAAIIFCNYLEYDNVLGQDVSIGVSQNTAPSRHVFSVDDYPDTLFNILPDIPSCFLYRFSFLSTYAPELPCVPNIEDSFFTLKAAVLATRIAFLDIPVVHHRIRDNLSMGLSKKIDDFFRDSKEFYQFLQRIKKFEMLRISFLTKVFDWMIEAYSALKEPVRGLFKFQIVHEILPYFGDRGGGFKSHKIYSLIQEMKCSSEFDYFWKNNRSKIIPIIIPVRKDTEAYYAGVTIQSLIENASEQFFYDIYILYAGNLVQTMHRRLENLSTRHIRITCMNIEENLPKSFVPRIKDIFDCHPFLLADLFPDYSKVIYIKPQVIIQRDIGNFWGTDMGNNAIAGVTAYDDVKYVERELGLIYENFINIQVMMLNLSVWRSENLAQRCLDLILVPLRKYKVLIRDIINYVCDGRIYVISDQYNGRWSFILGKNRVKGYSNVPEQFDILNYNDKMPWAEPELELMDLWWSYARKSPFYEVVLMNCISERTRGSNQQTPMTIATPEPMFPATSTPVLKSASLPINSLTKKKIMMQKKILYPIMCRYVKEAFLTFITFGKVRETHKKNISLIMAEIQRKLV